MECTCAQLSLHCDFVGTTIFYMVLDINLKIRSSNIQFKDLFFLQIYSYIEYKMYKLPICINTVLKNKTQKHQFAWLNIEWSIGHHAETCPCFNPTWEPYKILIFPLLSVPLPFLFYILHYLTKKKKKQKKKKKLF